MNEIGCEYFLGIEKGGKRILTTGEIPQFESYTIVYLTRDQVKEIVDIPEGDMEGIQKVLSKYY